MGKEPLIAYLFKNQGATSKGFWGEPGLEVPARGPMLAENESTFQEARFSQQSKSSIRAIPCQGKNFFSPARSPHVFQEAYSD